MKAVMVENSSELYAEGPSNNNDVSFCSKLLYASILKKMPYPVSFRISVGQLLLIVDPCHCLV